MAYLTLAEARLYCGLATTDPTTDDTLISAFITAAQAFIERQTGRVFEAATETRKYHAEDDVSRGGTLLTLHPGDDLLTITALTNGDGATIASANYALLPTNLSPKYAIQIKTSSGVRFTWSNAPEEAISIAGTWGFSATVPADVKQGMYECVNLLYKGKDSQTFGNIAFLSGGELVFREGLPLWITRLIRAYARTL